MSLSRAAPAVAALVALTGLSCAKQPPPTAWSPLQAGLYKVRLEGDAGDGARRFRLLLFAELPDRFHGEVISPLGRTELIADAGGGRISILFVRDRVAFAGIAGPGVIEDLLGVELSIEALLAALLTGELSDERVELARSPATARGLPDRLELSLASRSLVMQLKRRQELRVDPAGLGTGLPPADAEVRPLESLSPDDLPGVEIEGGS